MQCLINTNRDIYFSLALEEYLLMHEVQDFFILWLSEPCVVVGKHQNALAEINYRFVSENGIQVARRLSGGGTVYHDQGNLNFTFIANGEPGKMVDFKRFIEPVIHFLGTLGIVAEQGPKNEILARGKKISGNAEHVYKSRVLHHGTLLFHSNLDQLRECIRVIPGRYKDKAVQSNRSSVINVSECLNNSMAMAHFEKAFFDYVLSGSGAKLFTLSDPESKAISELAVSKYRSWQWIYGWSPDYELNSNFQSREMDCQIFLKVHRGLLTEVSLKSEKIPGEDLARLIGLLLECRHEADSIRKVIHAWNFQAISGQEEIEPFVWSFF
jgi:lipoate---protein ligase